MRIAFEPKKGNRKFIWFVCCEGERKREGERGRRNRNRECRGNEECFQLPMHIRLIIDCIFSALFKEKVHIVYSSSNFLLFSLLTIILVSVYRKLTSIVSHIYVQNNPKETCILLKVKIYKSHNLLIKYSHFDQF